MKYKWAEMFDDNIDKYDPENMSQENIVAFSYLKHAETLLKYDKFDEFVYQLKILSEKYHSTKSGQIAIKALQKL